MATHSVLTGDAGAVKLYASEYYSEQYYRQVHGMLLENGAIKVSEEVGLGQAGDQVTVNTFGVLEGAGFRESQTVENNEQNLARGTFAMTWDEIWQGVRVPSKTNIQQMRLKTDLATVARDKIMDWHMDLMCQSVLNQGAGNTATSITALSGQVFSGTSLTNVTGLNAATAPTTNRIVRPNSRATDQALTTGDDFTLALLDDLVAQITSTIPTFEPISDDIFAIGFLHPKQVKALKQDTSGAINWANNALAFANGGSFGNLKEGSNGMRMPIAQYENILLYVDPRVPLGVNSSTNAAVSGTRRAVFFGKGALYAASPLGISSSDTGVPIELAEESFDYKRFIGTAGGGFYGFKKFVGKQGEDNNVAVIATLAT